MFWVPNFIKIKHIAILRPNLSKYLISGHDPQFQISYLWLTNLTCSECFISLGIYFIFGTKFFWNEEIDICFNVECVLLGRNFDFLGGYVVVTARYLVVTTAYCSLPAGGYCSLPVAGYCWLLLIPTFSINDFKLLKWESNSQPLHSLTNVHPFRQNDY